MNDDTTQVPSMFGSRGVSSQLRSAGTATNHAQLTSSAAQVSAAEGARSVEDDDLWPWVPSPDGGLEWRSAFS